MGVRIDHKHGNKECFVTTSPWTCHGSYEQQAVVDMPNGSRFTVAYLPYTGSWYAFDIDAGKEIARLDREFYEAHIKPYASPLVPDPDCLVKA